jgi:hypothetical protein
MHVAAYGRMSIEALTVPIGRHQEGLNQAEEVVIESAEDGDLTEVRARAAAHVSATLVLRRCLHAL